MRIYNEGSKKCRVCKEFLPRDADHFYRLKNTRDGLDTRCKKCDQRRTASRRVKKIRIHKNQPCMDCGLTLPMCAMSFDHLPGEVKFRDVSQLGSWSKDRIAQEVAKCDVVCLNCHALRTYYRSKGLGTTPVE
jgi:hypothetical protein